MKKYEVLIIKVVVFIVFVWFMGILSQQVYAQLTSHQIWGLSIGISEYQPRDLSLTWPDKDAAEFTTFLRYGLAVPEGNYRILRNTEATKANILEHLYWLSSVASPGDRVYIFYSGHGLPRSPILPHDSQNLLSKEELMQAFHTIPAREVVVFIDACYSGKLVGKGTSVSAALRNKGFTGLTKSDVYSLSQAKSNMVIITSADGIQQSYEMKGQKNGIFTYYLMRALMDKNRHQSVDRDRNGNLSLYEIYQDVYWGVTGDTEQQPQISNAQVASQITVVGIPDVQASIPAPVSVPSSPVPSSVTRQSGMSTGTKLALGVGAAAAVGGGAALIVAAGSNESSGSSQGDGPFTGIFTREYNQQTAFGLAYHTSVLDLSQSGNTITGTHTATGMLQNCCTASYTTTIRGTANGLSANLNFGDGYDRCEGPGGCSYKVEYPGYTYVGTLVENERILRFEFGDFIRQ